MSKRYLGPAFVVGMALACGGGGLHAEDAVRPQPDPTALRQFQVPGVVGKPFRFGLVFKNRPDHFEAEGLPPGLVIDRMTGTVTGTPTAPGATTAIISAVNANGRGSALLVITVAPAVASPAGIAAQPSPMPARPAEVVARPQPAAVPPAPTGTPPTTTHGKADEEADEPDPYQAVKDQLRPWTDNMRRSVENALLPGAATLPAGDWYYRIVHTARQPYYADWKTNLLGLDDNVKVGILVGYGLAKNWDLTLQRTNGHGLQVDLDASERTTFDYYDLMLKHKLLDQLDGGIRFGGLADVAVTVGVTDMQRNQGTSLVSINLALLVERNFLHDRLRIGSGLAFASMSAYEQIPGSSTVSKLFPDEYDALAAAGTPPDHRDPKSTLAVPLSAVVALTAQVQIYGEAVVPIDGYRSGGGPSMAAGVRLNTNTHQYSIFFSNTGNIAYNSVISGGSSRTALPLFGFYITAFF